MINSRERVEGKHKQWRRWQDVVHLTADLCAVQAGTLEVSCCLPLLPLNLFHIRQQQQNLDFLHKPTSVWCTHTLARTLTHTNTLAACVCGELLLPAYRRILQTPISPPAKWSPRTVKRWGWFPSRVSTERFTNKKRWKKEKLSFLTAVPAHLTILSRL